MREYLFVFLVALGIAVVRRGPGVLAAVLSGLLLAGCAGMAPAGAEADVLIHGGLVFDGGDGPGRIADVAIRDGVIVAIGALDVVARRVIDAVGLLVTPGFVDLHTHYDGQAIWSDRMTPSSAHGVTTAVMGNCGVGFAPCRPDDHATLVDVMAGVPSVVAAIFVFGMWVTFLQFNLSAFAVSLALVLLMIPLIVRSTEEMLKLVPDELREASYALGVPKWLTIVKVVLPTALGGIVTGVTLAIARVIGETAPLMVTIGFLDSMNANPFHDWMSSLPTFIYQQLMRPISPTTPDPSTDRAWAAALVLIVFVMLLNLAARLIANAFAPKTAGR